MAQRPSDEPAATEQGGQNAAEAPRPLSASEFVKLRHPLDQAAHRVRYEHFFRWEGDTPVLQVEPGVFFSKQGHVPTMTSDSYAALARSSPLQGSTASIMRKCLKPLAQAVRHLHLTLRDLARGRTDLKRPNPNAPTVVKNAFVLLVAQGDYGNPEDNRPWKMGETRKVKEYFQDQFEWKNVHMFEEDRATKKRILDWIKEKLDLVADEDNFRGKDKPDALIIIFNGHGRRNKFSPGRKRRGERHDYIWLPTIWGMSDPVFNTMPQIIIHQTCRGGEGGVDDDELERRRHMASADRPPGDFDEEFKARDKVLLWATQPGRHALSGAGMSFLLVLLEAMREIIKYDDSDVDLMKAYRDAENYLAMTPLNGEFILPQKQGGFRKPLLLHVPFEDDGPPPPQEVPLPGTERSVQPRGRLAPLPFWPKDDKRWPFRATLRMVGADPVLLVGGTPKRRPDFIRYVGHSGQYKAINPTQLGHFTAAQARLVKASGGDEGLLLCKLYLLLCKRYRRLQGRLLLHRMAEENMARPDQRKMQRPLVFLMPGVPRQDHDGVDQDIVQLRNVFEKRFGMQNIFEPLSEYVEHAEHLQMFYEYKTEPHPLPDGKLMARPDGIIVIETGLPYPDDESLMLLPDGESSMMGEVISCLPGHVHVLWITFTRRHGQAAGSEWPNEAHWYQRRGVTHFVCTTDGRDGPSSFVEKMVDFLKDPPRLEFSLERLREALEAHVEESPGERWLTVVEPEADGESKEEEKEQDVVVQGTAVKSGNRQSVAFSAGYEGRQGTVQGGAYENEHGLGEEVEQEDRLVRLCQEHIQLKKENRRLRRAVAAVREAADQMLGLAKTWGEWDRPWSGQDGYY